MNLVWASQAKKDMEHWLKTDARITAKIQALLKEIVLMPVLRSRSCAMSRLGFGLRLFIRRGT